MHGLRPFDPSRGSQGKPHKSVTIRQVALNSKAGSGQVSEKLRVVVERVRGSRYRCLGAETGMAIRASTSHASLIECFLEYSSSFGPGCCRSVLVVVPLRSPVQAIWIWIIGEVTLPHTSSRYLTSALWIYLGLFLHLACFSLCFQPDQLGLVEVPWSLVLALPFLPFGDLWRRFKNCCVAVCVLACRGRYFALLLTLL